jgi:hypothetical protein
MAQMEYTRAARVQQQHHIHSQIPTFCDSRGKRRRRIQKNSSDAPKETGQVSLPHIFICLFLFSRSFLPQLIAPAFFPCSLSSNEDVLHFWAHHRVGVFRFQTCEHAWIPFYADIEFYFSQLHFLSLLPRRSNKVISGIGNSSCSCEDSVDCFFRYIHAKIVIYAMDPNKCPKLPKKRPDICPGTQSPPNPQCAPSTITLLPSTASSS